MIVVGLVGLPELVTIEPELVGLLAVRVITLLPADGPFAVFGAPSVVVSPDGPPDSVMTEPALVAGRVTTLLPLAGTVIRFRPPGTVVVTPDGPPRTVVRTAPLTLGELWVTIVPGICPDVEVPLGPTNMVNGLPFGSVVTMPFPQVGEGEPTSTVTKLPLGREVTEAFPQIEDS